MRYVGIPTCPYCRKRVNIIRTWSLKRQGEYQCPRCGGISNIYLSPLIYVLALLAIFAGGSMYFFHKFVLDDITLETALYVFIPFAAFFLLSLFMVYLEKPVIKKVPKSEYGRRRRKNAQDDMGLPRGAQEYAEFSGNSSSRKNSRKQRAEAPRQMPINQENFNRAKQQTATMNAMHESGMVPSQPRSGAASPANVQGNQPAARQQAVQRTAAQQEVRQMQSVPQASQVQRAARPAVQQASQRIPQQRTAQRTVPTERPVEAAVSQQPAAVEQASRTRQETQYGATAQRRSRMLQEASSRQIPAASQQAGAQAGSSLYQRPGAARPSGQQTGYSAYQRAAAAQSAQRDAQQTEHRERPAAQQETPLTNFHSQAMQRQRAAQQYSGNQPAPYPVRNPNAAVNRQQQGQPYGSSGQTARPQAPTNLSGTAYARHQNPYGDRE